MNKRIHKIFPALGTVNTIDIPSCPDENIIISASERVLEIHRLFSAFDDTSDISRINTNAGVAYVPVHQDTVFLLEEAIRFSKESDGAFDVTIRPLVSLWGFVNKASEIPDSHSMRRTRKLINWKDILIDKENNAVKLRRKNQSIDLGGIAKGYAVDEVRRILIENDIQDGFINLGGSVAVIGVEKSVGIQHPDKATGEIMGRVNLQNKCVVTSGSYEKNITIEGKQYHHIIDPFTGWPSESGILSVTLIGSSALMLDALSTAFFVLGMQKGLALAARWGAECIIVDKERNVFVSESLKDKYQTKSSCDDPLQDSIR